MKPEVFLAIFSILFGVVCTLVGIIFATLRGNVKELQESKSEHEIRLQKLEDSTQFKYERLLSDMTEFKSNLKALTEYVHTKVHSDAEIINQQKDIINRLHKFLDLQKINI